MCASFTQKNHPDELKPYMVIGNFISTHCPEKENKTFENFVECQRDYLKVLARFLNITNQLIRWFRMAQKPVLMPTHDYMPRRVQLFGHLTVGSFEQ
jgi:hypothetical protein